MGLLKKSSCINSCVTNAYLFLSALKSILSLVRDFPFFFFIAPLF